MAVPADHHFPLDPRDVAEIERVLKPLLNQLQAQLILFGSRARGKIHRASDIDLAVRADRPIPLGCLPRYASAWRNRAFLFASII